jgi:hypothetical protein
MEPGRIATLLAARPGWPVAGVGSVVMGQGSLEMMRVPK